MMARPTACSKASAVGVSPLRVIWNLFASGLHQMKTVCCSILTSPRSIADAVLSAIENKNLREKAAGLNPEIIAARAEYSQNMQRAEGFYEEVMRTI